MRAAVIPTLNLITTELNQPSLPPPVAVAVAVASMPPLADVTMFESESASGTSTPRPDADILADFIPLSDQIYLQKPPSSPICADPSHPTTIVIYGWGDALPKHVSKYIAGYQSLFPSARIILIFSPILRAVLGSLPARTAAMQPVVDALFGTSPSPSPNPYSSLLSEKGIALDGNTLIHAMSNTGGINLAATMNAYTTAYAAPLPYKLMVLDSTPGSTDFFPNIGRWSRAMALGAASVVPLPLIVLQGIAMAFLSTITAVGWATGRVSAPEYSVAAVNRGELSTTAARRVYLYSKEDDIIHWGDIEQHAAQARERGYQVEMEMFEGTSHVEHMREWPVQYWGAVGRAWEGVGKGE